MGEPAIPTEADRKATRELAAKIVDSVRNDEPMQLGLNTWRETSFGSWLCELRRVEELVFQLAQEIDLLRAEFAPNRDIARLADICRGYQQRNGVYPMWATESLLNLLPKEEP